ASTLGSLASTPSTSPRSSRRSRRAGAPTTPTGRCAAWRAACQSGRSGRFPSTLRGCARGNKRLWRVFADVQPNGEPDEEEPLGGRFGRRFGQRQRAGTDEAGSHGEAAPGGDDADGQVLGSHGGHDA